MIASDRVSPSVSSRPSSLRIAVVVMVGCWLLVASPVPLMGAGMLALLALLALDVALWVWTGWLPFVPTRRLDERQAALRDRAYRIGFRLVGAGVLVMIILSVAGAILESILLGPRPQPTPDGLSARTVFAVAELLAIAPTAVIAWLLPAGGEAAGRNPIRWLPLLTLPVATGLWLIGITVAPVQTVTLSRIPDNGFEMSQASCGHFAAVSRVAAGFDGVERLDAEVCWNGQQAFTFGDPSLPRPANLPAEEFSRPMTDLTNCAPAPGDRDFSTVDQHCTAVIDAGGTLHLTMVGHVAPFPGGIASRDVRVDLVVTRDGKVVSFG